jgi:ATP sulfurylase
LIFCGTKCRQMLAAGKTPPKELMKAKGGEDHP